MRHSLILSLIIFSSLAYGQSDFETLSGDGFTIDYPSTWEVNQSGQMGMTFALFSPIKFDGDQFRENVNLVIQDLSGHDMDLTDFVNLSENQIRTMMQDGEILKSEKSGDYHLMVYSGTMGQYQLKFSQRYWLIDNKAYILTLTAEQAEFDNYKRMCNQIMDSFQIK